MNPTQVLSQALNNQATLDQIPWAIWVLVFFAIMLFVASAGITKNPPK